MTKEELFQAMEDGDYVVYEGEEKEEYFTVNDINRSHVFLRRMSSGVNSGTRPVYNEHLSKITKRPSPKSAYEELVDIHDMPVTHDQFQVKLNLFAFINKYETHLKEMY